jgi:hypothetical protein
LTNCTFPTLNQNTTGTAAGLSTTLAVASGGTGLTTTPANGALDIGNGTGFTRTTLTAGSGVAILNSAGGITISATGAGGTITSVSGTSPVVSSGGTAPAISLAAGYGDTLNPYASKTANFMLAAPNGSAGVPTFRAMVTADVPTLNQNTTGTAANVTGTVALGNGGSGQTTAQAAMNAFAAAVTSGSYLRGNGTNVVMSTIQAADVPTLNQNTTGTAAGLSATLAVASGGTGVTTSTGSGNNVLSTSPTLVTPILGTPTSGTLTNCTFPTLNQNTTGTAAGLSATLAVGSGGTGSTTLTANNVLLGNGTSALQTIAPSTSGNLLTSNGTTWASTAPVSIGVGQTWQDVTASRAVNTTYTNTTGKPIFWHVDINSSNVTPTIAGVAFQTTASVNNNTNTSAINLIVPVGATYSTAGGGITFWIELR